MQTDALARSSGIRHHGPTGRIFFEATDDLFPGLLYRLSGIIRIMELFIVKPCRFIGGHTP